MANKRTYNAQAAVINGVSLGGTTQISIERGHDVQSSGALDGQQGGSHGVARGAKFVRGSIDSEDITKMITLLTAARSTGVFFAKESGAATWLKRTLKNPVMHNLRFASRFGGRSAFTLDFECQWDDADDFKEVDLPLAAEQTEPTIVVPSSYAEPTAVVYKTDPADQQLDVTVLHVKEFSFNVGGQLLRDTNPGVSGYDSVEYNPGDVTFSIGFADHTVSGAPAKDRVQELFELDQSRVIEVTLRGTGVETDKIVKLNNAVLIGSRDTEPAQGYAGFVIDGKLEWTDAASALYALAAQSGPPAYLALIEIV